MYYEATNRFKWITTNPQTVLDGLLTDIHTGLNGLLQIQKPVYMVFYKPTNRFRWFTTKPQTGLSSLLTDLHSGLDCLLTDFHIG